MKTIGIFLLINFSLIGQCEFEKGTYTLNELASIYTFHFQKDSTFSYTKRTGLSVDDSEGIYTIVKNEIHLRFKPIEPDSGYLYFKDSLKRHDSVYVQIPRLRKIMKRPSRLYVFKKKLYLFPVNSNREARRSKFRFKPIELK